MTFERKLRCTFCNRDFKRKSWYEKHTCTAKMKFLEQHSILVIKAHRLFNHWQRRAGITRKGREKSLVDFQKSPYYNLFKNLTEYTYENYVVSGFRYVDWIVDHHVPEKHWFDSGYLERYREYLRINENPIDQVKTTFTNIRVWCRENEIPIEDFFRTVSPVKALVMIRSNQIFPWVLFSYDVAMADLLDRFEGEVLYALDEHINVKYWLEKIEHRPNDAQRVQELCEEEMNVGNS